MRTTAYRAAGTPGRRRAFALPHGGGRVRMASSAHGGSPKGGPPHDGSLHPPRDEPTARTRRGLGLLVWPVAMCWLGLQALGRAGMWLLTGVDAGTSAVARAAGAATRAL